MKEENYKAHSMNATFILPLAKPPAGETKLNFDSLLTNDYYINNFSFLCTKMFKNNK